MADYRLNLSDGTTTIDLYGGADSIIREAGLSMPPPNVNAKYISNDFWDGSRLASASYSNRTIELKLRIQGTSLADLKTNIRSIQRLLNDAQYRNLKGYGDKVYLEYQWGDAANESTFFDVLRGELLMPSDFMSVYLKGFYIREARLRLVCQPFGRYTTKDIGQDTLENSQSPYDLIYSYLVDDSASFGVEDDTWEGQTFTTTSAFTIAGFAIKCYRTGAVTDVTGELYATALGVPDGGVLATCDVDVRTSLSTVSDTDHIQWVRFIFDTPYALSDATMYAVAWHIGEADPIFLYTRYDAGDGAFANGTRVTSANGGTDWATSATDDCLFGIYVAETPANYQDVVTAEAHGDAPAKVYWKLNPAGEATADKMWLAKRSGARYDDDLWIEGEDYWARVYTAGLTYQIIGVVADDVSGGLFCEHTVEDPAGIAANTVIGYPRYQISYASIPKGSYKVLVRCRVVCQDSADYDHLSFGVGWVYGDSNKAPSYSNGDYYECSADSTWEILDLGLLNILPISESDIAANNTFYINIYNYANQALTGNEYYKWQMDYIFLLPIDEGVVIVDEVTSTRVLVMDGITAPPLVFETITNTESRMPDYIGSPFTLGRETTRLYVLRDATKAVTFASDVKYQPQFIVI